MPKFDDPGHQPTEELLTVEEVAKWLRVDTTTVNRWIRNGVLEAVKLPNSGKRTTYRVKKSTLDNLINPSPTNQPNVHRPPSYERR